LIKRSVGYATKQKVTNSARSPRTDNEEIGLHGINRRKKIV